MVIKIQLHKIISYFGTFTWLILGLLTMGSIINSRIAFYINIGVGLIFILIAYYLNLKARSIKLLINNFNELDNVKDDSLKLFLRYENIFVIISFLLGLILLVAAMSRIFGEKVAVFG